MKPSGGANRPSQLPANRPGGADRPGVGNRPGGGDRPGGIDRPGADNRPGIDNRPAGSRPGAGNRPDRGDVGNFLGIGAGAAGGAAIGGAMGGGLGDRGGIGDRGGLGERTGLGENRPAQRPEDRPNWSERSQNRNENWNERVDKRSESWQQRNEGRQERRDDFAKNREDRWDNLSEARNDRQDWRDQNREDWQDHREDMWDYRFDRADEIWDNVGDHYDDIFDDHWWGGCGWGHIGHYPANPWWWWAPVTWAVATNFVYATAPPQPIYIDYGTTVVQEGKTVYVDNKPVPAEQYNESVTNLAVNVEQPAAPAPPAEEGAPADWMPLGVFALAQEEKGDPVMFFQISISKDGKISGGYESILTGDQKPIAGQIDKETQNLAWRIGDNKDTVYASTLANLTQDVSTVAVHFGEDRVQNWLLVRMPEPPAADEPVKAPELDRTVPPANPIPVKVQ